jgi:cytochrome c biogenesis protein CcmG/thiol:disulfide interchange protein DsbE
VKRIALLLSLAVLAGACSGRDIDISAVPELAAATPESMGLLLAESDRPVVLNVWASWCIPCRSEAPLLERAAAEYGGDVRFIGINFRDSQTRAREFIAEFFPDAPIEHVIDNDDRIPASLGGTFGVPQTFFFAQGGELVTFLPTVIDERTLALNIDEILSRSR